MAYGLKWQIPFVNDKGVRRTINIYKEGYSGSSHLIEGSDTPITTQESTNEDMLCPVRTQTGYLSVVDNLDLDDLKPTSNLQHKVMIEDDDYGTLWTGYMKAAEYSATWSVAPNVVQLPIISRLEALGGIEMDSTKPLGMVTFGELIAEAAEAIGGIGCLWIPAELTRNGEYWWPMKLSVSRANFIKRNNGVNFDDPDYKEYDCNTYKEMLEKICSLFGWCLREREEDWVMSSPTSTQFIKLTMAQLAIMAATTTLSCTVYEVDDVEMSALSPCSVDHKRDELMGARTFEVEAKTNEDSDFLPTFKLGDFAKEYVDQSYNVFDKNANRVVMFRHGWLGKKPSGQYKFRAWTTSNSWQDVTEMNWDASLALGQIEIDIFPAAAAAYGKLDICRYEEINDGTKKYWNYDEGLLIRTMRVERPTIQRWMPLVEVTGMNVCNIYGGALCWNPTVMYDNDNEQEGVLANTDKVSELYIRVQVGDKYWNGNAWTTSPAVVAVPMDEDKTKVVNMKTLSMPYNDAEGYIIPVDDVMSGEVKLTIYEVYCSFSANILLQNVQLKYVKKDIDEEKGDADSNHYYSVTTNDVMDGRKKVTLEMATDNNNAPGYGILFMGDEKVDDSTFAEGRLENVLLGKLKTLFGRKVEKLTLHVEADDRLHPAARISQPGVQYHLLSEARNWMTDESTIICESLPG